MYTSVLLRSWGTIFSWKWLPYRLVGILQWHFLEVSLKMKGYISADIVIWSDHKSRVLMNLSVFQKQGPSVRNNESIASEKYPASIRCSAPHCLDPNSNNTIGEGGQKTLLRVMKDEEERSHTTYICKSRT